MLLFQVSAKFLLELSFSDLFQSLFLTLCVLSKQSVLWNNHIYLVSTSILLYLAFWIHLLDVQCVPLVFLNKQLYCQDILYTNWSWGADMTTCCISPLGFPASFSSRVIILEQRYSVFLHSKPSPFEESLSLFGALISLSSSSVMKWRFQAVLTFGETLFN